MRDHWPRARPTLDLDVPTIEGLIAPLFPCCRIVSIEPVEGGLTNTNWRLRLAGRETAVLLRIYQRSGELAQKEMALCHLVEKNVPVPPFLHFAPENPVTGHAFAVLDWIEAKPLQDMLPQLDATALAEIGASIGTALAAIHRFTYDHFGFLDGALNLGEPIDLGRSGLIAYLRQTVVEGLGGLRLGKPLTNDILRFAEREGKRIEAWQHKACLVHGDFNPSNILVRKNAAGAWDVAAIIDWEYAFVGAPGFDFGILLRPPLDAAADFVAAVEKAYRRAGGEMPDDWRRIARITDLFSYADVLHHPETRAAVVADVAAAIRRLISE